MELDHPEYFIAIADEGSISRAAQRLYMAQPSLSQYVHRLEQELGAELMHRQARGITLTPAGKIYYAYAQQVVHAAANLRAEIAALGADLSGDMLVSASVLSVPVGRLYCSFKNLHPRVEARFIRMEQGARTEVPDVVVTTHQLPQEEWSGQKLLEEQLLVAVSPKHSLARKRAVRIAELAGEKFIYSQNREVDQIVTQFCREAGFAPDVLMEYYSMHSVTALVEEGLGITILPEHQRLYLSERLALLPISDVHFTRTVYLYRPLHAAKNPAADAYADYLKENIRQVALGALPETARNEK